MGNEKGLHPRNIHNKKYDFKALMEAQPELSSFVKENQYKDLAIDYSDANAVICLNKALLAYHYNIQAWTVAKGHLCPPIPGRVDYIHYIADLLAETNNNKVPVGTKVKGLDIGTGTSCIYPILGNSIYGWKFVGSDINPDSINHAKKILNSNPTHKKNIKIRFQKSPTQIFKDLIKNNEKFDFTMCNPPFYSSPEEAKSASNRKIRNLNINKIKKGHTTQNKISNFGGLNAELWCPGGETSFIKQMIIESESFNDGRCWFTTLVSNKSHLDQFYPLLKRTQTRTIQMHHGQKISHILAWKW
jgi:23S rRNA (adenine1618-N6)-methyltransferase